MSKVGIIGGSGLYDIEGLEDKRWVRINTPFGRPSEKFLLAKLGEKEIVFLPRHGRGHRILPSGINYRANIYGMKMLGVERIISVSACGSLKEEIKPLDFVIPTQFIDRTNQARKYTFFDEGIVAHISFSKPVCPELSELLYNTVKEQGLSVHFGGIYLNMEGPQFSTLAESNLYRMWGADIIGMTNMAEARLAREAEICYATLAAVTDYDCWRSAEEEVTAELVIKNLLKNVENAKKVLRLLIPRITLERKCFCKEALKDSIVTPKRVIPYRVRRKLSLLIKDRLS